MWRFVVIAILAWSTVEVQSVPVVRAAGTTPSTTNDNNDGVHTNEGNCLTWWLHLASTNSTASTNVQLAEKLLKNTMIAEHKTTVADLDPALVTYALGGDSNVASHLINCTGSQRANCALQNPCLNSGQCLLTSARHTSPTHQFKCHCADGYRGMFCSKALPRCTSQTCVNGGTCKTTPEGYVCICPPLHTGQFCQTQWLDIAFVSDTLSSISQLSQEQTKQRSELADNSKKTVQEVAAFMRRFENRLMSSLDHRQDAAESSIQTLRRETAKLRNITSSNLQKLSALSDLHKGLQSPLIAGSVQLSTSSPTPSVTQSPLSGSVLDATRKSANIQLSNGGRTAMHVGAHADGTVVGTVGYSSGVWQWRIRVSGIGPFANIGIGATTLPVDHDRYSFSHGTTYVWFSNQATIGLAQSQTRGSAKIGKWQSGDMLTLTLDCDNQLLHLYLPRTAEKKTITLDRRGRKLYLYVYMDGRGDQVDIM